MRISHFFIDRPIFAAVVSIVIVILGAVSFCACRSRNIPRSRRRSSTSPANIRAPAPRSSPRPWWRRSKQQINGVENMLYMSSNSTADGRFSIAVTFELGTNLDIAQVQVQNRVAIAQPRLPADVRNIGVTVKKASPDLMMVVHLYSPDKSRDTLFISNYATLEVTDALTRVDGVGSITVFGSRDYSMRVWLDPDRLQSLGMTASDVVAALQGQNIQVASGVLDQPPVAQPGAFQISVRTLGRLADPEEFGNIIVKETPSAVVRLKDVGTVELGGAGLRHRTPISITIRRSRSRIFQRPGSNALETAKACARPMAELSKRFPTGIKYDIIYNPTQFIQESVDAVVKTIGEAIILVVLVVDRVPADLAGGDHSACRHPGVADRHVLPDGSFGFTLNNLSLFGLVLAIGIVVDDAIVVVENVERNIAEGLSPRDAARRTHGRSRRRH